MRDPLEFEKTVLPNGITVYGRKTNDPFVFIRIYVPLGHIHNTGLVIPGSAHLLEHMCCKRSIAFPEKNSFSRFTALNGGYYNAHTGYVDTKYHCSAPASLFHQAFQGLVSQVFEPTLSEEDLQNEVSVISNERNMKNKWYPAETQLDHYMNTQWKHACPSNLNQIFGSDEELQSMTIERLQNLHQCYFNTSSYVIVGGDYDQDFVASELSRFHATSQALPEAYKERNWVRKEYHEVAFPEENNFTYCVAGITEESKRETLFGLHFLGKLLTNSVHGPLNEWLRNELGWSYGVDFGFGYGNRIRKPSWGINLPVNTHAQATHVRSELHGKIEEAISNPRLIAVEQSRRLAQDLFSYQTLLDSIEDAESHLGVDGRIELQSETQLMMRELPSVEFLRDIYETHMAPGIVGEILTTPEP